MADYLAEALHKLIGTLEIASVLPSATGKVYVPDLDAPVLQEARAACLLWEKEKADQHSDDAAVDRFAVAMKAKLAKKRADGRGGWDNPAQCSADLLSRQLREHVEKGDPVDVGNLAMMLYQRGERIASSVSVPVVAIANSQACGED